MPENPESIPGCMGGLTVGETRKEEWRAFVEPKSRFQWENPFAAKAI